MILETVADRYEVPVSRVRAWIRSGELVAVDVSKKTGSKKPRYVVTEAALVDFERRRSTRPPASNARRRKEAVPRYV